MPSFTEENLTFDPVEEAVAAFSTCYLIFCSEAPLSHFTAGKIDRAT